MFTLILLLTISVVSAEENNFTIQNKTDINDINLITKDTININENETFFEKNEESKIKQNVLKTNANGNIYTNKNIWDGANRTANFIDKNHRLPSVVGINGKTVNMNDMLYLMCKSLNTTTSVSLGNYTHVLSDSGTNDPTAKFTEKEYLTISNKLTTFYENYNRNLKTLKFKNITINFDDTVYMFARIGRFIHVNKKLPSYSNIITLYNNDYSTEKNALKSTSKNHFIITTSSKYLGNGMYNITLKSSETATIYYTINGSIPTNSSYKYSKTLTIYNKTWIRFFGINKNNEKTPVLNYGIDKATLPYITSKTKLLNNGYENGLNISTVEPSTIYYTIDGSKPTTNSPIYTDTLTIHNNTLLQYFSINKRNNKQSPTYYFKLQNPTPYATILNKTDVRDNHQNITIIANKPGKIYYTTNGSIPTDKDIIYKSGQILTICLKTKIRAILIDETNKISKEVSYKPPNIITPSIPIISALWSLDYKSQDITLNFNKVTRKVCYTTDNSNPKNSSTRKWISLNGTWYQYIPVGIGKTLKLYTKSDEGYYSDIYSYKVPYSPYAIANVTVINLTNIYNDGTQKIGIQMDQSGGKTAYINNNERSITLGFYNEVTTKKNTTFKIRILNNHSNRIDEYIYTRESGLKYVMYYHYKMKIPYQKLKIKIDSKNIINLENKSIENNLKNNKSYFYNYTTKKYEIKTIKQLYYPGLLIYKENNQILLDFYDYTYGNTNQVSVIKELTGTKQITTSVINNGIKNEIATIYLPSLDYIECNLRSNDFYDETYSKDYLSTSKINGKTLESIETYVLTNQKIDYNIINETLNKFKLYNKTTFKSVYGTYLTGLTHMYLYNALRTTLGYALNVTTYNYKDTQMSVSINSNGQTFVRIFDGNYGTDIISDNETNTKIFNFMSGIYGSYLEGTVLNLAGNNKSYSAMKYFSEDLMSNKKLNFSYNNKTNTFRISTLNNNDYYIEIGENGYYSYIILNNRYDSIKKVKFKYDQNNTEEDMNETLDLFGGGSSKGFGWNYEEKATYDIMDFLTIEAYAFLDYGNNFIDQLPTNEKEVLWDTFNLGEDIAGSMLITTGIGLLTLTGPALVPAVCIGAGVGLCFLATGVNSPDDLTNGYYYLAAIPSVITSLSPVGVSTKVTSMVSESLLKQVAWSTGNAIYQKTEQLSTKKFIDKTVESQFKGYSYNALLNSLGFYKN